MTDTRVSNGWTKWLKGSMMVLLLAAPLLLGCGGADELARSTPRPTVQACCNDGGILPDPINGPGNEYGVFVERRGTEDRLWFTSNRAVPGKKPTALPGEMFYCRRAIDAPSMITSWSAPMRNIPIEPAFDTWTRGAVAIHGDVMILAAEQPLEKASPFVPGGTSYHLFLWQLTRDASGKFVNPMALDRVNHIDYWTSQPAISPDGTTLLFVSNRPNPNDPADKSLNIWRSVNVNGEWREPAIVRSIASRGDDISPSFDAQGNVYFASNWDFRANQPSKSGFDLWSAGDVNALAGGGGRPPRNMNELTNMEGCHSPCKYDVNTQYDEVFPFVFLTPTGRHLFYSSNRPGGYGGYDLYACVMPAPCVRIKPVVLCYEGGAAPTATRDTKGREMPGEALLMEQGGATREVRSGEVVEVKPGAPVTFTHMARPMDCERMECKSLTFVPELSDEVRTVPVPCDCNPPTLETILISDASGIPYFITGYWEPNNSRNFADFQKKWNSGALKQSKYINPTDYDYACASRAIDAFFEANVYARIENALKTVEACTNNYSLMITVVGFTDACGLSQGRYTGPDVEFGGVLIPNGQDMWAASLREKGTGRNVPLQERGQAGNVILSMLRAHYTMKTIDEEMQRRSERYKTLKGANRIVFNLEGMGIYRTDLWRSTAVPTTVSSQSQCRKGKMRGTSAACNDPEGRRIEIYVKQIPPGAEAQFTKPFETDFLMEEMKDPAAPVKECDCYRMEYAFDSKSECEFAKSVIEAFGAKEAAAGLAMVERAAESGKTQYVLQSDCLPTREQANSLGAITHNAMASASRDLTKVPPRTDPACTLYRVSFGTFRYAKNAETLADRLKEILGIDADIESVRDPVRDEKVYAVHAGHFKSTEIAETELAGYVKKLKERNITVKARVVL